MINNINYSAVVEVKFYGPTSFRGSRIKLVSNGKRKFIDFGYEHSNSCDQAIDWLLSKGAEIVTVGCMENGYIIMIKSAYINDIHILDIG